MRRFAIERKSVLIAMAVLFASLAAASADSPKKSTSAVANSRGAESETDSLSGNGQPGVSAFSSTLNTPLSTLNSRPSNPAERGYRLLRTKAFLPADFDQDVFDDLWKVWPEPERSRAKNATPEQRRKMAFSRYGLMEAPERKTGPAFGYVDDGNGGWVMNCFACHAGKVAGKMIPGAPNTHIALATLTDDVRLTKLKLGKKLTHLDLGSLKIPLGDSIGVTNSVIFGVALGALRDEHMNVVIPFSMPALIHHAMDAPPWWNVRKKPMLYCDGFSPKNARVLLQFILIPQNSPKTIKSWEQDYRDILAYIESCKPPEYPWKVNSRLAERGRTVFTNQCSRCHGTYGKNATYEQTIVPIEEIGTDPVRLEALSVESRRKIQKSWMSHYGKDKVILDPGGYVAPPLDGIWASAPYFHNGSTPTLWHVLHPEKRPAVWKRTENGYDREKVGLEVTSFEKLPENIKRADLRRLYYDTSIKGKSNSGHR
ncbi:MAG: c-type cytochrome, partial [Planctomycetes bacterium]|nr:c-type cytochrome [Planctomycetota bacterium]